MLPNLFYTLGPKALSTLTWYQGAYRPSQSRTRACVWNDGADGVCRSGPSRATSRSPHQTAAAGTGAYV